MRAAEGLDKVFLRHTGCDYTSYSLTMAKVVCFYSIIMRYKKPIIILSLFGLFFFFLRTVSVLAGEILPRISTVCENKLEIIVSINDGFSILKECPKGSRKALLIGEKGPKGDKGDKGDQGPRGESGITNQSFYSKTYGPTNVNFDTGTAVHMECDSGDVAISGGLSDTVSNSGGYDTDWNTVKSGPSTTSQNAWDIFVTNTNKFGGSFTTVVICLKIQ